MAQTNFTAADMYPKASVAAATHAAPAPAVKKAKKAAQPVVEAPVAEEIVEEAPVDSE